MTEPTTTTVVASAGGLGALIFGAFKWLLGREVARIDKHGERLDALERGAISKEDLDRTEVRIIKAIADVQRTADKANSRIDDMLRG